MGIRVVIEVVHTRARSAVLRIAPPWMRPLVHSYSILKCRGTMELQAFLEPSQRAYARHRMRPDAYGMSLRSIVHPVLGLDATAIYTEAALSMGPLACARFAKARILGLLGVCPRCESESVTACASSWRSDYH